MIKQTVSDKSLKSSVVFPRHRAAVAGSMAVDRGDRGAGKTISREKGHFLFKSPSFALLRKFVLSLRHRHRTGGPGLGLRRLDARRPKKAAAAAGFYSRAHLSPPRRTLCILR